MTPLRNLLNWLSFKQMRAIASVTSATVFNNIVGFGINLLAARSLGKDKFGLFSLAFTMATMTSAIAEFGLNLTVVRLFNKHAGYPDKQAVLLGSALALKSSILLVVLAAAILLGNKLASLFGLGFSASEQRLFTVALFTGGVLIMWTYIQTFFQCHHSFGRLTKYLLAYAGLRVALSALAFFRYPRNPLAWLSATYTVPGIIISAIGLLPQVLAIKTATVRGARINLRMIWETLDYSKWVALSSVAYISLLSIVRFILLAQTSTAEVGVFSAGIIFTMAFSTLSTALRAVLFPKVTTLNRPQEMNIYLSKLRQVAPYYCCVALVIIGGLAAFQYYMLGEEYRAALPIFLVTSFALASTVFLGLGTMLVHTMLEPQIDAYMNWGRLVIMTSLSLWLIPHFKALGAGIAYAVPIVAGEFSMFLYVRQRSFKRAS